MRRFVSLTLLLAAGFAGCQSLPWREEPAEPLPEIEPFEETLGVEAPAALGRGLRLSTEQRFTDVPLPVGVKEDLDRTFVYESADLQIGRMVYTSKASVNALAQFYLDEAPVADWERASLIEAEVIEMVPYLRAKQKWFVQGQKVAQQQTDIFAVVFDKAG